MPTRRALLAALAAAPLPARGAEGGAIRRFHFAGPPVAGAEIVPADLAYTPQRGFGFEPQSAPGDRLFSIQAPEGTYRVTATLGGGPTTIKAESRRLMLEAVRAPARGSVTRSFVVNVRDDRLPPPPPNAPGSGHVRLNPREAGSYTWDDRLTLEILGDSALQSLTVEPADVPTVYLAGDSTVTDQRFEPAASWGQMLPRFFDDQVAIANHAESGETLKSFLAELRLDKLLTRMKAGDWMFIQFGHNDSKASWPQTYAPAETTYRDYLKVYIAEARRKGATPVLLTPPQRRRFDAAGKIVNTHGAYPDAVKAVGAETGVPVIDLAALSARFYEALGPHRALLAFNDGGRDATHHDNYGAYQLARCVVQAIRDLRLPLATNIAADIGPYDPRRPPPPEAFDVPASSARSEERPRGS